MADAPGGGGGGGGILIAIFLIVLASWFMAGAAHRLPLSTIFTTPSPFASSSSPFSFKMPHAPTLPMPNNGGIGSNQGVSISQDDYTSDIVNAPSYSAVSGSPYQSSVQFGDINGALSSDPSKEYVTITANPRNTNPVVITNWKIQSSTSGKGAVIGGGVDIPVSGATEAQGPIVLNPGDSAIVATGRAQIGVSFRENICSGYFGKFQPFTPPLGNSCPSALSDLRSTGGALNNEQACLGTASAIPACTTVTATSNGVSNTCTQFLETHESYNGCISAHQKDPGFELPVWRIYLGQNHELWNNSHDYLELLDQDGNLVSATSY